MTPYKQKFWMVVVLLTIISGTVYGQTNVSGGIYTNTTWTKVNSPYIVTDTVVVFPGVTLTIEPGVEVRFEDDMRLEVRQASLVAMGTVSDSITFTSNSPSPHPGSWGNIYLNNENGSTSSSFDYCNLHYADFAIYIFHYTCSAFPLPSVTINHSLLSYNKRAVFGDYNQCTHINVHNSYFHDNVNYGIYANSQGGTITNSIFVRNSSGIIIPRTSIKNCRIDSNAIVGVVLPRFDTILDCQIKYNGIGLKDHVNDVGYSTVMRNAIENNDVGIKWTYSNSQISNNTICNNISYDFYSTATFGTNVSVPNNCWCTSDSANISARIYDGYDNTNLGLVNYMPLDTTSCNLTFCDLAVSASAISPVRCYGDSNGAVTAIPIRGTAPYNFSWNNGQNTDTVSGLSSGTYSVTVTDLNGCTANNSFSLQDGLMLNINLTATSATCDTCHNGSATAHVTNGSAPFIYTWNTSPIQTAQTATGLQSGSYTVCVRDVNGCVTCDSVFVDSTNCVGLSIVTQSASASCSTCNDGTAWTTVTGGTPPYNYTWYTTPIQTNDTATGLLQGTYVVCVNDLYSCMACDTVTVSIGNCSAFFDLYPDTIPHNYFAVNRASGTSPITYSWDWGDGSFDTVPFPIHTYSSAGFYTICLSITDSVGCTDTHCTSYYLLKTSNEIIQVTVVPELLTGISEKSDVETVLIYPNPASNIVTVELTKQASTADINVFNILGQLELSSRTASQKTHTDITELTNGVYVLEVRTNKMISRQKFIKE